MSGDDEIDLPGAGATARPSPVDGAQLDAPAPVEAGGESAEIAAALASDRVDAAQAQALLIDRVIAEQLPLDMSPTRLEAVRAELASLLEGDPTLAALLDPR